MVQSLTPETPRLDFEWLDPRHERMKRKLTELSSEKGYRLETVNDVCSKIFNGITGDQYVSGGVPIIKLRNVTGEGLDWDTDFVLRKFYDEHADLRVFKNDILVTCTGDGSIGRADVMDRDEGLAAVDVVALRPNEKVLPLYLLHFLRSIFGQMQFEKNTVGSTGQTHLRNLDKFLIVYPQSKDEQREKVKVSEEHMSKAVDRRNDYESEKELSRKDFAESLGIDY
jgi:type I restriction enzyme S subunit